MIKESRLTLGHVTDLPRPVAPEGLICAFQTRKRVSAVKKSVLLVFSLIGLGVAGYFLLPLTPIPDYVNAVIDRADKLF